MQTLGFKFDKPVRKKTRLCKQCGVEYALNPWRITECCSVECSNRWRAKQVVVTRRCKFCGNDFQATRRHPNVACSQRCFYQSRRRVRVCNQCGKQFEIPGSLIARKYCSHQCSTEAITKRMPLTNCLHCGKAIQAKATTRPRKFCSRTCMHKHMVGPNNSLWRGQRAHERGITWAKQRDLARKRDADTCQHCGEVSVKGQKVSVDHIVPYRIAIKYTEGNPLYDANDLFNLICLCRKCHSSKTRLEMRIIEGDVVGFMQSVKRIIPLDRLIDAMRFSQLPVPSGGIS